VAKKVVAKDLNKSEEIRKVATKMKAAGQRPRPKLIIEELAKRGIKIAPPQVSIVLKKMGMRRIRRKKKAVLGARGAVATPKPVNASVLSVEDLLAAKQAAVALGGSDRAIQAIQALKRLEE
jgi:arginine repressor